MQREERHSDARQLAEVADGEVAVVVLHPTEAKVPGVRVSEWASKQGGTNQRTCVPDDGLRVEVGDGRDVWPVGSGLDAQGHRLGCIGLLAGPNQAARCIDRTSRLLTAY